MINKQARQALVKARSKLMKSDIGMATMLLHLNLVEVDESVCSTMATDGKRIIYCPTFVLDQTELELQGVMVHEALHCVWEHPLRKGSKHHKVWNIACDYAINGFLKFDLNYELPDGGLWDRDYQGKSAESIYRELLGNEEALQEAINDITQGKGDCSDNGSGGSEGEEESSDESNISDTGQLSSPECKTGEKVGDIDLDSIPLPVGEVWEPQSDEGEPLSEQELDELKTELQRSVSLADKLEKAMSQDGTSSMSSRVDAMKQVSVDWKDELKDFLESNTCTDNSWSRLNKRHQWRGINLPSKAKSPQGGELAIAIDTSGSVSQYELNMFATEIQAMAEDCGLEKIRVCYCDTTVRKNADGEWWDTYELDQGDDLELRVRGGGGTKFDPPFELFNDYSDDVSEVQAFVYFTDGYGYVSPEVEPNVPVLWCVTEESIYSNDLKFGEKIYVDVSSFY